MNLSIVLGTAREDRVSYRVSKALENVFKESGIEPTFVDVKDHVVEAKTTPPWGKNGTETTKTKWQEIARNTDVFVFVIPEYNHGYPGEWKLLMDSLYTEYAGKHAFVVGVSDGHFAGARVIDHVKPILVELQLRPYKTALYVGKAPEVISESGELLSEELQKRFSKFVDSVIKIAS